MKSLFKNKSFYLGLAATFAVAAGLYIAFPTSKDASNTDQATTSQPQKTETAVQPATNTESTATPVKSEKPAPVINVQPNDGGKQNVDPVSDDKVSDGQI